MSQIGWRSWYVDGHGALRSGTQFPWGRDWPSNVEMVAECIRRVHGAPASGCTCGLYSWTQPYAGTGKSRLEPMRVVYGAVEWWGVAYEHEAEDEEGVVVRAQYARPVAICDLQSLLSPTWQAAVDLCSYDALVQRWAG